MRHLAICMVSFVVAVPSVAPPVAAKAEALRRVINTAASLGQGEFKVPPGVYVFSNTSLTLSAHHINLHASGATFVFYYGFGFACQPCYNASVHSLVLDSGPPNYAQGSVTSGSR